MSTKSALTVTLLFRAKKLGYLSPVEAIMSGAFIGRYVCWLSARTMFELNEVVAVGTPASLGDFIP